MKQMLFTSLIVMLCTSMTPTLAQHDSLSGKIKPGLKQVERDMQRFDVQEDLRLMTLLTKALEKDNLIDTKKSYKLEIKDGEFYINDNKQPKAVTDKFRKYFRADQNDNYTILNNPDEPLSTSKYDDKKKHIPSIKMSHPNNDRTWFDGVNYQNDLERMTLLISGLEKDGLLERNKPYKLEVKRGELFINDKKQPSEVTDKFRKYFQSNNYALIND